MHIIASCLLFDKIDFADFLINFQTFYLISVENGDPPQIEIEMHDTRKTDSGMS